MCVCDKVVIFSYISDNVAVLVNCMQIVLMVRVIAIVVLVVIVVVCCSHSSCDSSCLL